MPGSMPLPPVLDDDDGMIGLPGQDSDLRVLRPHNLVVGRAGTAPAAMMSVPSAPLPSRHKVSERSQVQLTLSVVASVKARAIRRRKASDALSAESLQYFDKHLSLPYRNSR